MANTRPAGLRRQPVVLHRRRRRRASSRRTTPRSARSPRASRSCGRSTSYGDAAGQDGTPDPEVVIESITITETLSPTRRSRSAGGRRREPRLAVSGRRRRGRSARRRRGRRRRRRRRATPRSAPCRPSPRRRGGRCRGRGRRPAAGRVRWSPRRANLLEDPLPVGLGHAGPGVLDRRSSTDVAVGSADPDRSPGCRPGVYLAALASRSSSTAAAASGSATTPHRRGRDASISTIGWDPCAGRPRPARRPARAQSSRRRSGRPALVERGRPEQLVDELLEPLLLAEQHLVDVAPAPRCRCSSPRRTRVCRKPFSGVSGVRSSWLTVARKSAFSSSSGLRAVTSRATTTAPPPARGEKAQSNQRSPSGPVDARASSSLRSPVRHGQAGAVARASRPRRRAGTPRSRAGRRRRPPATPVNAAMAGFQRLHPEVGTDGADGVGGRVEDVGERAPLGLHRLEQRQPVQRRRHPLGEGVEDLLVALVVGPAVEPGADGDRPDGRAVVLEQAACANPGS